MSATGSSEARVRVAWLPDDQPACEGVVQVPFERRAIVLSVEPLQDETADVVELDDTVPAVGDQHSARSLIADER